MNHQDFIILTQMGHALCGNPTQATQLTEETWAAISLLKRPSTESIERACRSLLGRSKQESPLSERFLGNPFFQLTPEERMTLVAIHCAQWTYEQIGRVLQQTPESIERLIYSSRLQLIQLIQAIHPHNAAPYPTGSVKKTPQCPSYHFDRPWMQRFLDGEMHSPLENQTLEHHLIGCDSCRTTLMRWRQHIFQIDTLLQKTLPATQIDIEPLKKIEHAQMKLFQNRQKGTFFDSLVLFSQHTDIQWILALCIIGIFCRFFR